MKALSIRQPWASMIASGKKTIETRTWARDYRGDILIVAGLALAGGYNIPRKLLNDLPRGQAIAIARLVDCRPMTRADEKAACCEIYNGAFAWVLEDIRRINPFPVKGKLGLFEVLFEADDHPRIYYPATQGHQ